MSMRGCFAVTPCSSSLHFASLNYLRCSQEFCVLSLSCKYSSSLRGCVGPQPCLSPVPTAPIALLVCVTVGERTTSGLVPHLSPCLKQGLHSDFVCVCLGCKQQASWLAIIQGLSVPSGELRLQGLTCRSDFWRFKLIASALTQ